MAVPTYHGISSSKTDSGTSLTISLSTIHGGSAPQEDDFLLAIVSIDDDTLGEDDAIRAPEGWRHINNTRSYGRSAMFWKIAGASEPTSPQFTWGPTEAAIGAVICYSGTDLVRPIARYAMHFQNAEQPALLSETTPVADCEVIGWWSVDNARAPGTISDGTWTERLDDETTSLNSMFVYTKSFASASSSTGSPTVQLDGTGAERSIVRTIILQEPQTASTKDVKVYCGGLTSPTSTGNQDITDPGFDVKALIVYSVNQLAAGKSDDFEIMRGIGADDGVSTSAQYCVGAFQDDSSNDRAGWQDNGSIITFFFTGNTTSPDLQAAFSSITNGFRLNWTTVDTSGHGFNYIAIGGDDVEAIVGADTGAGSVTSCPWRPDAVHVISQDQDSSSDNIAANEGYNSYGWFDDHGGEFCAAFDFRFGGLEPDMLLLSTGFLARVAGNGGLIYEKSFSRMNSDGYEYQGGSTSDSFFLALNWDNDPFPFDVEVVYADDSGTNGADQTLPVFADGGDKQLIDVIHSKESHSTAIAGTHIGFGSACDFDGSITQGGMIAGKTGADRERRRETANLFAMSDAGDLDSPAKIGQLTDQNTIDWSTNSTEANRIGFVTFGSPASGGTAYDRSVDDTASVSDSVSAEIEFTRSVDDTASVSDSVSAEIVIGASDTIEVSDQSLRSVDYVRSTFDSESISDQALANLEQERTASDSAAIVDSIGSDASYVRVASDSISISDQLSIELFIAETDTVGVSDQISRDVDYIRVESDSISTADSIEVEVLLELTDAFSVSDSVNRDVDYVRTVSDAASISDQLSIELFIAETDTVGVSDQISRDVDYVRAQSDSVSISESVSSEKISGTSVSDSVSVSEQTQVEVDYVRSASDSLSTSDFVSAGISLEISASDSLSVSDATFFESVYSRSAADAVSSADILSSNIFESGITATASQSSGKIPLAVFFDVVSGLSWDEIRDTTYLWDFDDGSTQEGYLAYHVFETAGTFNVTVTATRPGYPDKQSTIQITTSAFTGTVRVVSSSANFTDAPVGSTQYTDLATAWAAMTSGDQLLLRRGDTFSLSGGLNTGVVGPCHVGTFASGALPILDFNTNNGFVLNHDDWRIEDLRLQDVGVAFEFSSDHCLIQGCTVDSCDTALLSDGVGYTFSRFKFFINNTVDSHTSTNLVAGDYCVVAESTIHKTGIGHNLRYAGNHYGIIRDNDLTTNQQDHTAWTIRAANLPEGGRTDRPESRYTFVRGNLCESWGQVAPQNDIADEDIRFCIVERNIWQPSIRLIDGLVINAKYIDVRYNKFLDYHRVISYGSNSYQNPDTELRAFRNHALDTDGTSVSQYMFQFTGTVDDFDAWLNVFEGQGTSAKFIRDDLLTGTPDIDFHDNLGYFPNNTGECIDWDGDTDCTDPNWLEEVDTSDPEFLELPFTQEVLWESVVASDSVEATTDVVNVSASDSISVADNIEKEVFYQRQQSDALSTSDSVEAILSAGDQDVEVSDTASISDAVSLEIHYLASLSDSVALLDSNAFELEAHRIVNDVVLASDSVSSGLDLEATVSDSISISDQLYVELEILASDSIVTSDAVSIVHDASRIVSDSIVASDEVAIVSGAQQNVVTSDSVVVTDEANREHVASRDNSDSALTSDSVSTESFASKSESDSVAISDNASTQTGYERSIVDAVSTSDFASTSKNLNVSTSDSVSISDSVSTGAAVSGEASDSIAASDSLAINAVYSVSASDANTVSDTVLASVASLEQDFSDSVATADSISVDIAYAKSISDTAVFSDSVSVDLILGGEASDSILVTDAVDASRDFVPPDYIEVGDEASVSIVYSRSQNDFVDLPVDLTIVGEISAYAEAIENGITIGEADAFTVSDVEPSTNPCVTGVNVERGDFVSSSDVVYAGLELHMTIGDSMDVTD